MFGAKHICLEWLFLVTQQRWTWFIANTFFIFYHYASYASGLFEWEIEVLISKNSNTGSGKFYQNHRWSYKLNGSRLDKFTEHNFTLLTKQRRHLSFKLRNLPAHENTDLSEDKCLVFIQKTKALKKYFQFEKMK